MRFTSPTTNASFTITSGAAWPIIVLQTDGSGPHVWNWEIAWGTFKKSGIENSLSNSWDAGSVVTNYGGIVTVRARANDQIAVITLKIKGTNPSGTEVRQYLNGKPNSDGFDKILQQESGWRHFNPSGEPIKSFDDGYGMCQLTTPAPSFEQVWNWKSNVEGGLKLFADKRTIAIGYLSQNNRTYTSDQLKYEAVCRWNGGAYHEWDDKAGNWVRHPNILCDSATGNIGWDMTDEENKGKTESELHTRDSGSYGGSPPASSHWKYSGICYADKVLG
jgi:hypothetical protein